MSDPVLAPRPFDVSGALPSGVTVLEASAGTGKTYAIAALAARYVAEGIPLDRLLLVTFTRMATSELRDRVRERLVQTERGLGDPEADRDEVVELLAQGTAEEVTARRANLARALADFVLRGLDCGAVDATEVRDGCRLDDADLRSLAKR